MRSSDCGCRLNTAVQGGVAMWDAAALQGEAISQLSTMKCIVSQYLSNYCSTMQWPVCSPPAVGRVTETEDINQILQQPTHFTPSHAARPGTAALQRDGYRVSVHPEHSPASALIRCLRIPAHPAGIQLPAM